MIRHACINNMCSCEQEEQDNWSDQNGRPVTVTVAGGRALSGGNRHLTTDNLAADLETHEFWNE